MGADHHGYINRLKASLETFGVDSDRLEIQIMQNGSPYAKRRRSEDE